MAAQGRVRGTDQWTTRKAHRRRSRAGCSPWRCCWSLGGGVPVRRRAGCAALCACGAVVAARHDRRVLMFAGAAGIIRLSGSGRAHLPRRARERGHGRRRGPDQARARGLANALLTLMDAVGADDVRRSSASSSAIRWCRRRSSASPSLARGGNCRKRGVPGVDGAAARWLFARATTGAERQFARWFPGRSTTSRATRPAGKVQGCSTRSTMTTRRRFFSVDAEGGVNISTRRAPAGSTELLRSARAG